MNKKQYKIFLILILSITPAIPVLNKAQIFKMVEDYGQNCVGLIRQSSSTKKLHPLPLEEIKQNEAFTQSMEACILPDTVKQWMLEKIVYCDEINAQTCVVFEDKAKDKSILLTNSMHYWIREYLFLQKRTDPYINYDKYEPYKTQNIIYFIVYFGNKEFQKDKAVKCSVKEYIEKAHNYRRCVFCFNKTSFVRTFFEDFRRNIENKDTKLTNLPLIEKFAIFVKHQYTQGRIKASSNWEDGYICLSDKSEGYEQELHKFGKKILKQFSDKNEIKISPDELTKVFDKIYYEALKGIYGLWVSFSYMKGDSDLQFICLHHPTKSSYCQSLIDKLKTKFLSDERMLESLIKYGELQFDFIFELINTGGLPNIVVRHEDAAFVLKKIPPSWSDKFKDKIICIEIHNKPIPAEGEALVKFKQGRFDLKLHDLIDDIKDKAILDQTSYDQLIKQGLENAKLLPLLDTNYKKQAFANFYAQLRSNDMNSSEIYRDMVRELVLRGYELKSENISNAEYYHRLFQFGFTYAERKHILGIVAKTECANLYALLHCA